VLSLFGARLVQLQGLDAPTYAAAAEQGRLRTVALPAARGTITDRNGVALATTVAAVNITSDQTKVVDPAAEPTPGVGQPQPARGARRDGPRVPVLRCARRGRVTR